MEKRDRVRERTEKVGSTFYDALEFTSIANIIERSMMPLPSSSSVLESNFTDFLGKSYGGGGKEDDEVEGCDDYIVFVLEISL
ncbi:hypothetical protein CASFOL_020219 [Castilleja foliolosa]|uniref:Uncharacterized protein n=1 Tax=Castilleja foliolosa TaxID=1961234 RepID=A0ABD3D4F3_9LAMI